MPSYPTVFSVPLILYTTSTPNTSFAVPSGFTVVIREVDLFVEVGSEALTVAIAAPGADVGVVCTYLQGAGVVATKQWTGRVAVPEEYVIVIAPVSFGDYSSAYVGGYLLRNNLT